MNVILKQYEKKYLKSMLKIWNEVVREGIAFPQENVLDEKNGDEFFKSQTHTAAAIDTDSSEVLGLYILHPNNIGRCSHIANASFAVDKSRRGLHIGEKLVADMLMKAKEYNFGIVQFNAVVATNIHARHLYERTGFKTLGVIPRGFRMKDGEYEDIVLYYYDLKENK